MAAKFFGQFLLEKGVIDAQQLLRALEIQRVSNPALGELACEKGMLTADQAQVINERQRREDKRFGDLAQSMGLLTADEVGVLLDEQKSRRKLFGEILVEEGFLDRERLEAELRDHAGERDEAMRSLDAIVATHQLGRRVGNSIATTNKLFPRLLRGTHVGLREVTTLRGAEVEVSAPDLVVYADGERIGTGDTRIRVVPGALSALLPH